MTNPTHHPIENEFPRKGDSLFTDKGSNPSFSTYLRYPFDDTVEWFHYIEGYRLAADAVLAGPEKDNLYIHKQVFPVVFLYRHHFDLTLKTIVFVGDKMFGGNGHLPKHHDLGTLSAQARKFLELAWGTQEKELLDTVGGLIIEFSKIDLGSFAFRYPVTKDGDPSLPNLERMNLQQFAEVAKRLSNFLTSSAEGLWNKLGDEVDFLHEMMSYYGRPEY